MEDYEQPGRFYLGRLYDAARGAPGDELLLYDARDLTTHAVCVGMTGSGKTGLCVSLLEEAAIDGIPAIAIDPKGDLTNLLLTFPELRPADFRPWIDEAEAARSGQTPDELAARTAETWRKGLASWGQDGARIERLRSAADAVIYTPGSSAGTGIDILRSFAAPAPQLAADRDALRERVSAAASSLVTLIGGAADPLRSREHILLANLLERAWEQRRDLDLAGLLREIQTPPLERIGAMDLESFFPAAERFELAMRLNNLLAAPGFAAWMEGQPLDVPQLLWTPEGRPRIAILYIAHLSDAERMFFVTLLLHSLLAWMRTQPGTSSLRALLYMDEILGYFPPTANPPSKAPMLALLKQARAFGLGVVLATQNPIDLDYKGLSNAGTWFLGRLQTARDQARVLDGLEGASAASWAGFDRARMEATLAGLASRVFLMHDVHESGPVLFHSRWALSYLCGPLTREQIRRLRAEPPAPASAAASAVQPAAPLTSTETPAAGAGRPVLPPGVPEFFLDREIAGAVYRPALLGEAVLHYVSAKDGVDAWERVCLLASLGPETPPDPWEGAQVLGSAPPELGREAGPAARFAELPAAAAKPESYARWSKALAAKMYREGARRIWKARELGVSSGLGEGEGDFRVRLGQLARERRDGRLAELERRWAPRLAQLGERVRRAEERVAREESQYGQQKLQTAISIGATVLGAMFGRKLGSLGNVGRATTAARGASRTAREREDVGRASDQLEQERRALEELSHEFEAEAGALRQSIDPSSLALEEQEVPPRKADIAVERVALVWTAAQPGS